MLKILIIGGGFAGVWAAASAAKLRAEEGADQTLSITLVSAGDDLVIRPRLYQEAPHRMRVSLDDVLGPIGVRRVAATVTGIDVNARRVHGVGRDGAPVELDYDRVVVASGSRAVRPSFAGSELMFDVDTMGTAATLDAHLSLLPAQSDEPGLFTAVVMGAGFTGIEVATELVARLGALAPPPAQVRVVLVERQREVGPELGPGPRPVIAAALADVGVEVRVGTSIQTVEPTRVTLSDGTVIPTRTVVSTTGMVASPLTAQIPGARDAIGRLAVDEYLRVPDAPGVYAAGDTAAAVDTEGHPVLQSCQHALPQGKFVGHNVAADLLGVDLVPFAPVPYVTCLDLGGAGAVVTAGWDREVQLTAAAAKDLKKTINEHWIYPPVGRREVFELAGPRGDWPAYEPRPTASV